MHQMLDVPSIIVLLHS